MKIYRDKKVSEISNNLAQKIIIDDSVREKLDAVMLIALFDTLFKENKINKIERDSIISNIHRTYHLKK